MRELLGEEGGRMRLPRWSCSRPWYRPIMTNIWPMLPEAVLIAVDIAKLHHEVLIEVPNACRRRRLTVINCWARLVEEQAKPAP